MSETLLRPRQPRAHLRGTGEGVECLGRRLDREHFFLIQSLLDPELRRALLALLDQAEIRPRHSYQVGFELCLADGTVKERQ